MEECDIIGCEEEGEHLLHISKYDGFDALRDLKTGMSLVCDKHYEEIQIEKREH